MAALSLFLTRGPVISRNGSRRSLIETIAAKPNWKAVGYSIIVKEDQETTLGRVLFLHSKSLTAILRVFVLCQHWTKTRWIGNNDNNFARVDENFFTNNSIGSLSSSSSIRTSIFPISKWNSYSRILIRESPSMAYSSHRIKTSCSLRVILRWNDSKIYCLKVTSRRKSRWFNSRKRGYVRAGVQEARGQEKRSKIRSWAEIDDG